MSVDRFFNEVVPQYDEIQENFVKKHHKDQQQQLEDTLQIRAGIAIALDNAQTKTEQYANQVAYDAATVLARQLSVMSRTRLDYFIDAQANRKAISSTVSQARNASVRVNSVTAVTSGSDSSEYVEEPYLENGEIVFP